MGDGLHYKTVWFCPQFPTLARETGHSCVTATNEAVSPLFEMRPWNNELARSASKDSTNQETKVTELNLKEFTLSFNLFQKEISMTENLTQVPLFSCTALSLTGFALTQQLELD